MDALEVFADGAQLLGHAAREHDARLRVDDDLPAFAGADDRSQRVCKSAQKSELLTVSMTEPVV